MQPEPPFGTFEDWGKGTRWLDNAAGGSERAAYSSLGITGCGHSSSYIKGWLDGNVAHSSLFGWFSHHGASSSCYTMAGISGWKLLNYGFFVEAMQDIELNNIATADTKVGISVSIVGPTWSQRVASRYKEKGGGGVFFLLNCHTLWGWLTNVGTGLVLFCYLRGYPAAR